MTTQREPDTSAEGLRIWFDTEFIEDGETIELISIGMIAEDGRTLYLENAQCDLTRASGWVHEHVVPHLKGGECRLDRRSIADQIVRFAGAKPEFWAYYADYDWVVLCQLFGRMIDLPKGWPMLCRDIKQEAVRLGNPKLPEQDGQKHDALADAIWNKAAWEYLRALADAAGKAAPVPPPVEGLGDDLHTMRARSQAKRINDLTTERDGLAKEVERLKAQALEDAALIGRLNGGDELQAVMKINNDLVAKLAVYEAPIGDGEVEDAIRGLGIVRDLIKSKRKHLLGGKFSGLDAALTMLEADAALFRRLSAAQAECKGDNTRLREALEFYADPLAHGADGTPDFYDEMDFGERARAALAPASGEWTPTHRHANGDLYRLLPVEFHWEPEWDKPAVLYENSKGVKIGRFADVFAARFTPLAPASGEVCSHPKTVLHHTGDGTPVEFCPDCGRNVAIGNPPAKEGTTDANDHA